MQIPDILCKFDSKFEKENSIINRDTLFQMNENTTQDIKPSYEAYNKNIFMLDFLKNLIQTSSKRERFSSPLINTCRHGKHLTFLKKQQAKCV